MFQLVYVSRAVKPFSGPELFELLRQSREKNARKNITGFLLYKDGAFMQVLEGEEEAVRALYDTIHADPRHHHADTLDTLPVAERQFADWSMGFIDLDTPSAAPIPGYVPRPVFPPPDGELSWRASIAMGLLATFTAEHRSGSGRKKPTLPFVLKDGVKEFHDGTHLRDAPGGRAETHPGNGPKCGRKLVPKK